MYMLAYFYRGSNKTLLLFEEMSLRIYFNIFNDAPKASNRERGRGAWSQHLRRKLPNLTWASQWKNKSYG